MSENSPVQAGLYGIVKTADKEWSDVHCKSIDINPETLSLNLIEQALFLQGPLEVAVTDNLKQLVLVDEEISSEKTARFNKDDFIVITGGARGVTAEVAVKLAETYQCKLLLLGRSSEPEDEPNWLAELTDEAAIKKAVSYTHLTLPTKA